MNISIENTSSLGRRLKVSLPNDKLAQAIETRLAQLHNTAQLKGFRKGKVPTKLLKEKFGSSVRVEALEDLIRNSLETVIKDEKLNIAGRPAIEAVTDLPDSNIEYIASFEIYPTIELADLSAVDFDKTVVEISDQDIDSMIEKLKDRFCDWEVVERKTILDDRLTMDFAHQLAGETKQAETKKNVHIVLGAEGIVPGLSEALVGKTINETVIVDLSYPETWDDKTYAGKKVNITITIHKIEIKNPLSQADLLKKLMITEGDESELNAKLKDTVREKMQSELSDKLYAELKEKVLELLIEKNPLELPSVLVQQELQALKQEIEQKAHQGVKPGDSSETELLDMAQKRVLLGLLVREYIQKKELKINAELINKEIAKIARSYPYISPEEVIKAYYSDKRLLDSVERMVLLDEAVNAMLREMKIREVKRSFDEVMNPT